MVLAYRGDGFRGNKNLLEERVENSFFTRIREAGKHPEKAAENPGYVKGITKGLREYIQENVDVPYYVLKSGKQFAETCIRLLGSGDITLLPEHYQKLYAHMHYDKGHIEERMYETDKDTGMLKQALRSYETAAALSEQIENDRRYVTHCYEKARRAALRLHAIEDKSHLLQKVRAYMEKSNTTLCYSV